MRAVMSVPMITAAPTAGRGVPPSACYGGTLASRCGPRGRGWRPPVCSAANPGAQDRTDMERRLSRGASRISCRSLVGLRGWGWSAGWVAVRRAVRDAGQTDIRGFGVAAGPWFVVGSRCLASGVAASRRVAHSSIAGSPRAPGRHRPSRRIVGVGCLVTRSGRSPRRSLRVRGRRRRRARRLRWRSATRSSPGRGRRAGCCPAVTPARTSPPTRSAAG
jgi:hypothetical protein